MLKSSQERYGAAATCCEQCGGFPLNGGVVRKGLRHAHWLLRLPVQPARPASSSRLALLAVAVAVLVPGQAMVGPHQARAQTAGSQVEMFLGPSIGKQWTAIFSNHPRTTGNAPALTSCGTSPTISGTDSAGTVTLGTGTPTACTITFNAAYAAAPACIVVWRTNIASMIYDVSATAITLTQTATDSTVVDYHCIARSGG